MKNYAIIVAGGSGSRMKTETPKQFLSVNGLPVIMHTIFAFYNSSVRPEILVVLNSSFHSYWRELCSTHNFTIPHTLIEGGNQRFDSVKNALEIIQEESITAIHDAVRPVVADELISRCFSEAAVYGSAIPAVSSRDSLRKKEGELTRAINREEILIVQTPQVFKTSIIKEAYKQEYNASFTDDASVAEKAGTEIHTVTGEFSNIKITYPEDLQIASLFLKQKA